MWEFYFIFSQWLETIKITFTLKDWGNKGTLLHIHSTIMTRLQQWQNYCLKMNSIQISPAVSTMSFPATLFFPFSPTVPSKIMQCTYLLVMSPESPSTWNCSCQATAIAPAHSQVTGKDVTQVPGILRAPHWMRGCHAVLSSVHHICLLLLLTLPGCAGSAGGDAVYRSQEWKHTFRAGFQPPRPSIWVRVVLKSSTSCWHFSFWGI